MTDLTALAGRIDDAFHARDMDALAAFWDDDIIYDAPGIALRGKALRYGAEQVWFDAFPDARIAVRSITQIGDALVIESTMTGTHAGPLATPVGQIPPTGRRITGEYCSMLWFSGEKIVRQRIYFDRLTLLQDLGVVPGGQETPA